MLYLTIIIRLSFIARIWEIAREVDNLDFHNYSVETASFNNCYISLPDR